MPPKLTFDKSAERSGALGALNFLTDQRTYPNKDIPAGKFYKAFAESTVPLFKSDRTPDPWEWRGPRNRGGRTTSLMVDPNDPDIVYAGAATGGLWRLTWISAAEYEWEFIDTGYPVLGVNAIAVNPDNSNEIYIGTGEVYQYQNSDGGARRPRDARAVTASAS